MKREMEMEREKETEKDGIDFEPLENEPKEPEMPAGAETPEKKSEPQEKKPEEKSETQGKKPESGRKKHGARGAALLLAILLLLSGSYIGVAVYYHRHFLPGTSINGVDCSNLDSAQVAEILERQLQEYTLEIAGRDYKTAESGAVLGTVTAEEISLTYAENAQNAVDQLLGEQRNFIWLYMILSKSSQGTSLIMGTDYDETELSEQLNSWEACQESNWREPENAYISGYSEQLKGYEIIPETVGTALDMDQLTELAGAAILAQETALDAEAAGCYREAEITAADEKLVKAADDANRMLGAQITYDWNGTEVTVDAELLKEWVSIENTEAVLDEDAVKAFVKEQADAYDTYGKPRNFVTTLGVELTLPSGYYGWLTDKETETQELIQLIRAGSVEEREPVYSSTAKKKGMSDIGSSYVEADLTHQHLYLYKDGSIVFETDFVSGNMTSTPGCVTPQGVFGLTYKTTNAVLRGADYETPVNYWMPFYGNYGMHDATWRSVFGGDIYISNGSHGCINLPLASAATIYEYVSTGFPVVCYYYPVDPLAVQAEGENAEQPVSEENTSEENDDGE